MHTYSTNFEEIDGVQISDANVTCTNHHPLRLIMLSVRSNKNINSNIRSLECMRCYLKGKVDESSLNIYGIISEAIIRFQLYSINIEPGLSKSKSLIKQYPDEYVNAIKTNAFFKTLSNNILDEINALMPKDGDDKLIQTLYKQIQENNPDIKLLVKQDFEERRNNQIKVSLGRDYIGFEKKDKQNRAIEVISLMIGQTAKQRKNFIDEIVLKVQHKQGIEKTDFIKYNNLSSEILQSLHDFDVAAYQKQYKYDMKNSMESPSKEFEGKQTLNLIIQFIRTRFKSISDEFLSDLSENLMSSLSIRSFIRPSLGLTINAMNILIEAELNELQAIAHTLNTNSLELNLKTSFSNLPFLTQIDQSVQILKYYRGYFELGTQWNGSLQLEAVSPSEDEGKLLEIESKNSMKKQHGSSILLVESKVSVQKMRIKKNQVKILEIQQIQAGISKCLSLQELKMKFSQCNSADEVKCIRDAIRSCSKLTSLSLTYQRNNIGVECEKLIGESLLRCPQLLELKLKILSTKKDQEKNYSGAQAMLLAIPNCTQLKSLNLNFQNNYLGFLGAKAIANAIVLTSNSIRHLKLNVTSSEVTKEGMLAIANSIAKNQSLASLGLIVKRNCLKEKELDSIESAIISKCRLLQYIKFDFSENVRRKNRQRNKDLRKLLKLSKLVEYDIAADPDIYSDQSLEDLEEEDEMFDFEEQSFSNPSNIHSEESSNCSNSLNSDEFDD